MDLEDRLREALRSKAGSIRERNREIPSMNLKSMSDSGRGRNLARVVPSVLVAALLTVVALSAFMTRGSSVTPERVAAATDPSTPVSGAGGGTLGQGLGGDPSKPSYPSSYRVADVNAAEDLVSFDVITPDTQWTRQSDLMGVYVLPGKSVALDYRSPADPSGYVRQEYIEVYQAPWNSAKDPQTWYEEMLKSSEIPEATVVDLDGYAAFAVSAHSTADDAQANPSFLRVVVGDVEYQISGGEDLARLETIALAIVRSVNSKG